MSPTSWTESSVAQQGWQTALTAPAATQQTLLFGSMLIGGTGLAQVLAASYSEMSVAAASYTEGTVAATSWTEGSL